MLIPVRPAQFRRDTELLQKRGKDMTKYAAVLSLLIDEKPLPPRYRDHALKGKYAGFRDCHIEPDWVLIYKARGKELILLRTGTHSDILE